MSERIEDHMILTPPAGARVKFTFGGRGLEALDGEMISTALFANGIKIFSRHHRDGSPQGIFCANGQCAQCSVLADGISVKSCVTPVRAGMKVEELRGVPGLPAAACVQDAGRIEELETDALIIGGGPSGLAAAIELGKLNVPTIIVDDKHKPGGKLVLQTHKFFGSVEDCYAGTRGIDIADKLTGQLREYPSVKVWLNSSCVAVFSDRKAGVVRDGSGWHSPQSVPGPGDIAPGTCGAGGSLFRALRPAGTYCLVRPKAIITAAGAREKSLPFPGNTLPGVYGAGAFQTLVNRDLVRPSKKLFIVGGGNVGLIAAYHAMQAGIKVVGLIEAQERCGGYKVHEDKIRRLGVPVYTRHTILRAEGKEELERVTIAQVDDRFRPLPGAGKTFEADTLLIAVGLNSINEFHQQALASGMNAFVCGDAEEIAEASAAMFSGKITAHKVLKSLGVMAGPVPAFWYEKLETLKSRPGPTAAVKERDHDRKVYPVLHCRQEIPCNPCATSCPKKSIKIPVGNIMAAPRFEGECIGCFKCLVVCPGLAITIVDRRKDEKGAVVAVPFEIGRGAVKKGDELELTDWEGCPLGKAGIVDIRDFKADGTLILQLAVDGAIADKVAGVRLYAEEKPGKPAVTKDSPDDTVVCRCERVTLGEIRRALRSGVRDLNQLKAVTRAGMGACGSKTCGSLILSVCRSEGVKPEELTPMTQRPLLMETELGTFANIKCRTAMEEKAGWSGF